MKRIENEYFKLLLVPILLESTNLHIRFSKRLTLSLALLLPPCWPDSYLFPLSAIYCLWSPSLLLSFGAHLRAIMQSLLRNRFKDLHKKSPNSVSQSLSVSKFGLSKSYLTTTLFRPFIFNRTLLLLLTS